MMRSVESCGNAYNKNTGRTAPEKNAVLPNLFRKVLIVLGCPLCYYHTKLIWESSSNGEGK